MLECLILAQGLDKSLTLRLLRKLSYGNAYTVIAHDDCRLLEPFIYVLLHNRIGSFLRRKAPYDDMIDTPIRRFCRSCLTR